MVASSSWACLSFSMPSSPFWLPPPLSLSRSGVPLGAKAIRRGGGRAPAEEQQADDRQQLSGGTLRGSLLLSTLGECRQRGRAGPWLFNFSRPRVAVKTRGHQREERAAEATDKREERRVCVFPLTVAAYPFSPTTSCPLLKVSIGHRAPPDVITIVSVCW